MWACDPTITTPIISSYQTALPLFAQALQTFIAAQCALHGDHVWPDDALESVLQDPNYDFIIVGSGSAGAVLANRLSEIPDWKILLIEAGGNPTLATEIPQLFFNNMKTVEDWTYYTEAQEGACRSHTKGSCIWPRGKVLGGSSSINAMYYVRANKLDYDEWAAEGNIGWSYEDVLPYFKKSEDFSEPLTEELAKYHNQGGYLHVSHHNDTSDFENLFIKAATELGLKHIYDINGADQMGVTKSSTTIKNGVRQSTARAFLSPIKDRNNLHILKNALVKKILFRPESNIVRGVIVNKNGQDITINTKKEIIVSAGAINSPQLLLLSGIGPKQHLEDLGIEIIADLPVGENLQDHPYVILTYKMPTDEEVLSLPSVIHALIGFILEKKGSLSNTAPFRVISFLNTTDKNAVSPNIQQHYIFLPTNSSYLVDFFSQHDFSEEYINEFKEQNKKNIFLLLDTVLLKPKSRGKIMLRSSDAQDHPLIYPNYFVNKDDINVMVQSFKQFGLKLGETKAFKDVGFELEWIDIKACRHLDKTTDEFLECFARETTVTLYHPASTCKMGPENDESAVVDSELKVRKVNGLRVIDASIMPSIVRGNTNAPTIMIGEKGADLVKKTWLKSHTEL